jgi:hypothetical protein
MGILYTKTYEHYYQTPTARMEFNRMDHCATTYNNEMYVFAGRLLGTNTKLTQVRYDKYEKEIIE